MHDYLTVNGTKIAKSGAQAACPAELVASYGADAVRWWLLRAPAPAAITDFTVERLVAAHDRDLANTLGNLASRVLTLARREAHWRTPARAAEVDADLRAQAAALPTAVDDAVDRYDVRGACAAIVALAAAGNRFLETEAAWQLARRAEAGDVPAARRFVAVIDAAERLPRRRRAPAVPAGRGRPADRPARSGRPAVGAGVPANRRRTPTVSSVALRCRSGGRTARDVRGLLLGAGRDRLVALELRDGRVPLLRARLLGVGHARPYDAHRCHRQAMAPVASGGGKLRRREPCGACGRGGLR